MPPRKKEESSRGAAPQLFSPAILDQFSIDKPATPVRRALSVGLPSSRRTPTDQARTPGVQRISSGRRPIVVTPHGRAAQRELNLRRALTPGRDRRRSGRQQRETPRDILRQLSRVAAPLTERIIPTPDKEGPSNVRGSGLPKDDDLDDGLELRRPRFSLPIGDEVDEDDSLLEPPQSTRLENEDYTGHSIELPRRAASELPPGRFSRGSFGSNRMSDVFADLEDMRFGGNVQDSSYLADGGFGADLEIDDNIELARENTATLRGFDLGDSRLSIHRESDIPRGRISLDDSTAEFVFNIPPRESSPVHAESSHSRQSLVQVGDTYGANNADDEPMESEELAIENVAGLDTQDLEDQSEDESDGSNNGPPDIEMSLQETSMQDTTTQGSEGLALKKSNIKKKRIKVSKHGIEYPSLPAGVVKKLATTYARTAGNSKVKINKETLDAIMQATDWFFEQVSEDLEAYADHAKRKTIDESDIITLMGRQRQTNATTTPFSLAQRYLPRELLQELRMAPPSNLDKGRHLESVDEDYDEE